MDDQQLQTLASDLESDQVERKESLRDRDKIGEAICAFANDMPDHRSAGVVIIGLRDNGEPIGLTVTDETLLQLSYFRDGGRIQPIPSITVQRRIVAGKEVAVVVVAPSNSGPIRYRGRTWIRVGPRRAVATVEEERILTERRRGRMLPYDLSPISLATLEDLLLDFFEREYRDRSDTCGLGHGRIGASVARPNLCAREGTCSANTSAGSWTL